MIPVNTFILVIIEFGNTYSVLQYQRHLCIDGTKCLFHSLVQVSLETETKQPTRNKNVFVMGNKVLENILGAVDNIHIAPIDPRMLRLESSGKKIVPGLAHSLATRALGLKRVPILYTLAKSKVEILLDDHGRVERNLVRSLLNSVEFRGQDSQGVVFRIGDKERQVDQVVRVGELSKELKILGQIGGGILQRAHDKNSFLVDDSFASRLDTVEVDVLDRGRVDLEGFVVIEDQGSLHMSVPSSVLVLTHFHWRR